MSGIWSSLGSHIQLPLSIPWMSWNKSCLWSAEKAWRDCKWMSSVSVLLWKTREREQLEKKGQLGWEHHLGTAYKMARGTERHGYWSCRWTRQLRYSWAYYQREDSLESKDRWIKALCKHDKQGETQLQNHKVNATGEQRRWNQTRENNTVYSN